PARRCRGARGRRPRGRARQWRPRASGGAACRRCRGAASRPGPDGARGAARGGGRLRCRPARRAGARAGPSRRSARRAPRRARALPRVPRRNRPLCVLVVGIEVLQLIWGPVRCSPAARAVLLRCPQTPSASPSALALGLLSWGPVRCSRAARAPLLRCPHTPSASSSALALGLPSWGPVRCSRAARAPLLRCPPRCPGAQAEEAARRLDVERLGRVGAVAAERRERGVQDLVDDRLRQALERLALPRVERAERPEAALDLVPADRLHP